MVYQSEKTLSDLGDKLSEADKSKIRAAIEKVKTALKGSDVESIKKANEELTQAFYAVSEKIYSQQGGAQANPGGQGADPNPGGAGGGGYYDADYEVVDDDNKK
jgi:molecular chaperone DnaK